MESKTYRLGCIEKILMAMSWNNLDIVKREK
jgi:hypothetical protein